MRCFSLGRGSQLDAISQDKSSRGASKRSIAGLHGHALQHIGDFDPGEAI